MLLRSKRQALGTAMTLTIPVRQERVESADDVEELAHAAKLFVARMDKLLGGLIG
jgi:hypothetical protein